MGRSLNIPQADFQRFNRSRFEASELTLDIDSTCSERFEDESCLLRDKSSKISSIFKVRKPPIKIIPAQITQDLILNLNTTKTPKAPIKLTHAALV